MSTGRVLGGLLIFVSLAILAVSVSWLLAGRLDGQLDLAAAILGFALVLVVFVLPLGGGGVYLTIKGAAEAREMAEIARQRRILNVVSTRGRASIADLALETQLSREQVRQQIYHLVGKELFTGYINWNDGILYSCSAGEMRTNKCPNCGATRALVGKGVVQCEYCGSELFL